MSLQSILDQGGAPNIWTNLNVNSIRARSVTVVPEESGTVETVYLNPSGNDSNTGLAIDQAVVSFSRAIDVATRLSAELIVFQLNGAGNISGLPDCGSLENGYTKLLDFTPLSCKFVKIQGARIDEVSVDAAISTAVPADPYGQWSNMTGLSGLTPSAYTRGFIESHDASPVYCTSYANTGTQVSIVSNRGGQLASSGFDIYNLDAVYLELNEKTAILSNVPITMQDVRLVSSNIANQYISNLSGIPITMNNCHIDLLNNGFLSEGDFNLVGCVCKGVTSSEYLFNQEDVINILLSSCILDTCRQLFSHPTQMSDLYMNDFQLSVRAAGIKLYRGISQNVLAGLSNIIVQAGTVFLQETILYNAADLKACLDLDSSTAYLIYTKMDITVNVNSPCINAVTSKIYVEGDNDFFSRNLPALELSTSVFELVPSNFDNSPYNRFVSTLNYAIRGNYSSQVIFKGQPFKYFYEIRSGTNEAIFLGSSSSLHLAAAQAIGPDISTTIGKDLIHCTSGSSVIINGTNYANVSAGTNNVRLGQSILVAPSAVGSAVDIVPTAGAIAANSQAARLIVL